MEAAPRSWFEACIAQLRTLDPEQKPLWGRMSPQHMVEHIVGSWRISNGRARVKTILSEEEVAQRRDFLFSDTPYAKNIPNPVFRGGQAPPLRKESLSAAIDQLEDEMQAFFAYVEANPGMVETHPVFGDLDANGWLIFQTKHMGHHMTQFGLG